MMKSELDMSKEYEKTESGDTTSLNVWIYLIHLKVYLKLFLLKDYLYEICTPQKNEKYKYKVYI